MTAYVAAARAAATVQAWPEAAAHYRRALDLWHDLGQDPPDLNDTLADITTETAEALYACGHLDTALELLHGADISDPWARATLTAAETWLQSAEADDSRLEALGLELLGLVERLRPAATTPEQHTALCDLESQGLVAVALVRHQEGDRTAAHELLQVARRVVQGTQGAGLAHAWLAEIRTGLCGSGDDALALLDRVRDLARTQASFGVLRREAKLRPTVLMMAGRADEAATLLLKRLRTALRTGGLRSQAQHHMAAQTVESLTYLGRWDEAEDLATEVLATTPDYLYVAYLASYRCQMTACRRGAADVLAIAAEALAVGATAAEQWPMSQVFDLDLHTQAAGAARLAGDLTDACKLIDDRWDLVLALSRHEFVAATVLPAVLEVARQEVDRRRAACPTRQDRVIACNELLAHLDLQLDFDRMDQVRLRLALAELELVERPAAPEDVPTWAQLIAETSAAGDVAMTMLTTGRAAEVAAEAGDDTRACAWFNEARDTARRVGAEFAEAAFVRRAHALGIALPESRARRTGPPTVLSHLQHMPSLTARELEVLQLVAEGLTNRVIGRRLGITEKTASVHISNMLGKLGAGSRVQAVAMARAQGLLTDKE